MILTDAHTHSLFSHDGKAPREAMARAAYEKGLSSLYQTEHFDAYTDGGTTRVRYFEAAIFSAPPDPDPPVALPLSIEVGEMGEVFQEAEELLARRPYEFVLGALHHLRGEKGFLSREYFSDEECLTLFSRYLEELLATAEETDYDSLAHMDYPLRYFYAKRGLLLRLEDYPRDVEEILRAVIRRGKALELNTATLRKGYPFLMTGTLRRFREMGGKYVTVGSDAHAPEDIAFAFDRAEAALREAGFSAYTIYQNRRPVLIPLSGEDTCAAGPAKTCLRNQGRRTNDGNK